MRYLFLLISFIIIVCQTNPVKAQFLPPISFNNFFKMASEGDLQGLKNAQRRGLNINSVNQNGDTAICIAIKQKNYLAYRTLLKAGAKSNPDCVKRIPEYSHKAFLNNYNKQYGVQKNYLSSSKKWQSFLVGAGIAGGVGTALAGGGGGGGSGNNDTPPPSFDDIGNTDKCELNKCAEGCYTDLTCSTDEYCAQYNNCGGCEQCKKIDKCLINECAEGCYTNLTCPTGQKCAEKNNCNGCERCEDIPVCHTENKCQHPECYTNLQVPPGYKCIKFNDCGGCENIEPLNGCDVVTAVEYNPISHRCINYFETCPSKCKEIAENQYVEVNENFERCVNGYELFEKCYKKETFLDVVSCNPNYEQCVEGFTDENGECHSCIINTSTICDVNPNYEQCAEGFTDENGNCHSCIINTSTICDVNPNYEQCEEDFTDKNGKCHSCIINTSTICDVNPNYEQCADGFTDENGNCHSCIVNKTECIPTEEQSCSNGFYDEKTGKCYNCVNVSKASNNANITQDDAFNIQEDIPVKKIDYATGNVNEETVQINVFGFRANDGSSDKKTDCENCRTMHVYNAKTADGEINLDYSTETKENVIGLHSYENAYNAYDGSTGTILITNATGHVFGIYAMKNAYNASGHSTGTINIEVGNSENGSIYGMYSHSQKAINSDVSQATITIKNEHQAQKEIFGIFNGSMSINGGEGIIEITDTKGSQNIYGIYNGDMSGNEDEIIISATKGVNSQKVVGLHKNNNQPTQGLITITNSGNTLYGDKVIGIEHTGNNNARDFNAEINIIGGLYTTTGIMSSAQITQTPKINISDIIYGVKHIYGVNNTLTSSSSNTLLEINEILINNNNSQIETITGAYTNNPQITLAEDKSISINHTDISSNTDQSVYGIKYENSNNYNYLTLKTSGSGKISITLNTVQETTSVYGIYLDGKDILTQASSNSIPVEITNSGSQTTKIYGLYLNNANVSSVSQPFTNRGEIKSSGTGIGITKANIQNTANITADLDGIYGNEGHITNTGSITAKNGIYAENVTTITNSGTINTPQYGIYAKSTEANNSYKLTNSGSITSSASNAYGIYADNYNTILNTGNISSSHIGIYANEGEFTNNTSTINAPYIGIQGKNSTINAFSGIIGDTNKPKIGIFADNSNVNIDKDQTINATTIGIYANNSNVTNNGIINISSTENEMYGILGLNSGGARTTITNSGTINVTNSYNGSGNVKMFGIYAGEGVDVVNSGNINVTSSGTSIGSNSIVGGIYLAKGSSLNNSGSIRMYKTDQTNGLSVGIITASKLPNISEIYTSNDGELLINSGSIQGWTQNEYISNVGLVNKNLLYEYYAKKYLTGDVFTEYVNILNQLYNDKIVVTYLYDPLDHHSAENNHLERYIYVQYGYDGASVYGEQRFDLIIQDTYINTDISDILKVDNASISTTGSFETDMDLNLTSLGLRKFGVGKNGTIEAPSISGNVTAETSIVEEGFATTYTNEESFIGDVSGVNLISESALFNAELIEKGNNTADIVMTMKQFEDVVENESVAEYLQSNYTHKNNEKMFSQLKSFESSAEINSHLNKELGLSLLPNFAQENLQIFRSLNSLIVDDMFSKNLTDERMLVGYDYMAQERKSKGHITGYDNNSNSSYFLADTELNKNSRFGVGMSITQFDSDYDDNSSRDETFVSALASYMYKFNPNLKYAGVARLGYGFGDYNRNNSTNGYKANLHDIVYGLGNQLRYAYDMKYFTIEPQFEFNILGYYQRNMKEQIKDNSLSVASTNNLSVEAGVGLYASKSAKFNEWTNLKARLGAGYYRELANPYHDMKVSLQGMNGYYKTDASPIFDRDRYLLNADINLDWKQFNFYIRANWFIENDDTAIINAGIKYNF